MENFGCIGEAVYEDGAALPPCLIKPTMGSSNDLSVTVKRMDLVGLKNYRDREIWKNGEKVQDDKVP